MRVGNQLVNKLSNFELTHRMISRREQLLNTELTWKLIAVCVWKLPKNYGCVLSFTSVAKIFFFHHDPFENQFPCATYWVEVRSALSHFDGASMIVVRSLKQAARRS